MSYEKTLSVPASPSRAERITPSRMREGDKLKRVRFHHMRETEEGLTCAEGYKRYHATQENAGRVFVVQDYVFSYQPLTRKLFEPVARFPFGDIDSEPRNIVPYVNEANGTLGWYMVCPTGMGYMHSGGIKHYGYHLGGEAGDVHHERFFYTSGQRLYYTPAIAFASVYDSELEDVDGSGYIDLYSLNGNFIAAVSFRERLFLFRERGITRVRADGEALNFRADAMPYGCGTIVPGSVVLCGDKIAFLTERGFYAFDGYRCKKLPISALADCDTSVRIEASCYRGNYLACYTRKDGVRSFALYDFEKECARYIQSGALSAAGWNTVYFLRNDMVYSLTEEVGLPIDGSKCSLELTFSAESPRVPETLYIEGSGTFTLKVRSGEREISVTVEGGKKAFLPVLPDSRETAFTLTAEGADFAIKALNIEWRNGYGD